MGLKKAGETTEGPASLQRQHLRRCDQGNNQTVSSLHMHFLACAKQAVGESLTEQTVLVRTEFASGGSLFELQ